MSHWSPRATVLLLGAFLAVLVLIGPGPAGAQDPEVADDPATTTGPIAPPAASIVVDAETGEVVTASNERELRSPASTTKILTALLVRDRLDLDDDIGISQTAAIAPPRRIRLPAGTQWGVDDLLYATMLCSCNDAAWALGQAAGGGSMAGFASESDALAVRLGLEDAPVLRDPAGLDNDRSVRGGNLMSARDLAIAARAYLADPVLAGIATTARHEWVGGDGLPHSVNNLNRFLGAYQGAIGLKTGFTNRAGFTFVAAAERDGRTLVAVVLDSDNHYAAAQGLLDEGFLLAAVGEVTGDVLPPLPSPRDDASPPTTSGADPDDETTTEAPPTTGTSALAPSSDAPAPEDDVAAPPPTATVETADGGVPVEPAWLAAGGVAVLAGGGVALLAVRRTRGSGRRRDRIDRRPARPRWRDRRHRGRP